MLQPGIKIDSQNIRDVIVKICKSTLLNNKYLSKSQKKSKLLILSMNISEIGFSTNSSSINNFRRNIKIPKRKFFMLNGLSHKIDRFGGIIQIFKFSQLGINLSRQNCLQKSSYLIQVVDNTLNFIASRVPACFIVHKWLI